jgi:xanthine dehydrogenase YagR molybdenum-binding subunit
MDTMLDHMTSGDVLSPDTIARAPRRIEGRDKLMGRLRYAGDLGAAQVGVDALDVAVAIISTQATGRAQAIDGADALASPSVRLLMTHENAPRLNKVLSITATEIGDLLPLQDDVLHFGGQCIGVLVADTLENARAAAAALVRVRYSAPENNAAFTLEQGRNRAEDSKKVGAGDPGQVEVGHPEREYEAAPHKVDLTFETSPHHHNAMEPGAVVAVWEDDRRLTVHLPTQFCYGDAMNLGQAFGFGLKDRLPRILAQVLGGFEFDNNVRIISTMSGGAFGSKTGNVHLLLAPMAAKLTGRPVKLVLTRQQVFTLMPFRGASQQRLRLAADADGKLRALVQDALVAQGTKGGFIEPAGETVPQSCACANIRVHTAAARLDTNAPGWTRGSGCCLGRFAIESAVDELVHQIGMDPLAFRLLNHADLDPETGKEWSSKSLKTCYEAAAGRIGWFDRNPAIGSMREGRHLVGYGMATSMYPVKQMPAVA